VKIQSEKLQCEFLEKNKHNFERLGIAFNVINKNSVQVRQFPAFLRNKDVCSSFLHLLNTLFNKSEHNELEDKDWLLALISLLLQETYTIESTHILLGKIQNLQSDIKEKLLLLNSTPVDLTSELNKLM
jgi:DNA mismatch repair protein MutL